MEASLLAAGEESGLALEHRAEAEYEAGHELICRDGFQAARIEAIVEEASFTRGAFYSHFTSKEDLFLALLEERNERQRSELGAAFADGLSLGAQLDVAREWLGANIEQERASSSR